MTVSYRRGSQAVEDASTRPTLWSTIIVHESAGEYAGWRTGMPCVNTYELTPIKVKRMASTKTWTDKHRSYKARIRKNIIRKTIEIPIMVMEPSYRTK